MEKRNKSKRYFGGGVKQNSVKMQTVQKWPKKFKQYKSFCAVTVPLSFTFRPFTFFWNTKNKNVINNVNFIVSRFKFAPGVKIKTVHENSFLNNVIVIVLRPLECWLLRPGQHGGNLDRCLKWTST